MRRHNFTTYSVHNAQHGSFYIFFRGHATLSITLYLLLKNMIHKSIKTIGKLFIVFFCTVVFIHTPWKICMSKEVKNNQERGQWDSLLFQIKDVYDAMADMDTSNIPLRDKIRGWEIFLNTDAVQLDNPHSDEDDSIRKKIKERIEYWKYIETLALADLHEESNKPSEMRIVADAQWQKEILANKYFLNAKKYMDKGDYINAEICFEKLMSLGTRLSPNVYYLRSAIQVESEKYEDAVQTLNDYLGQIGSSSYYEEVTSLSADAREKEVENRGKEGDILKREMEVRIEDAKNTLNAYRKLLERRAEVYREELELLSDRGEDISGDVVRDYEKEEISLKPEEKNRIEEAKKMLITYLKQAEQKPKAYQEVLNLLMNPDKN
uniref:Tetratricopeptide repeat protein n=2 Tax=Kuenenia stuttgartiensis TaxID=174633 RepID=Q1Q3E1_KUEST|nr:unknown protein [Candidatus Kuenenia stuttgartiensis]